MAILETELRLKVFQMPHGRAVAGLTAVKVRVSKRMMYACVEQFRVKAGLALEPGNILQRADDLLVCQHHPIWVDENERKVDLQWFASGLQPMFVSKNGTMRLMNIHCKKLVRSEGYPLTQLMEDFGEDPLAAMLPDGKLLPGQQQGKLALSSRF